MRYLSILLISLLSSLISPAQPPHRNPAVQASTVAWLAARATVREATRYPGNDGPAVAALIRAGGGNPATHPEYCGFTQAGDQRAHGLPYPGGGMQGAARCWFTNDKGTVLLPRTFYFAGRRGVLDSIQVGDLLGFDHPVVHHITRCAAVVPPLRRGRPPRGFWSWGGNEGRWPNAGMKYTYYPGPNITAAARWDYK